MTSVLRLLAGSAGALALLGAAGGANASVVFNDIDSALLALAGSDFFGADLEDEPGAFEHEFSFSILDDSEANSSVTTIRLGSTDIDFTSIFLDGFAFTQTGFDPNAENWELATVALLAGGHTITLTGSVVGASGDGAYSGVLNVASDGGGGGNEVPEPSTWAMMILGFGGTGAVLRRRRNSLARA